jgi:hypothetical protein
MNEMWTEESKWKKVASLTEKESKTGISFVMFNVCFVFVLFLWEKLVRAGGIGKIY